MKERLIKILMMEASLDYTANGSSRKSLDEIVNEVFETYRKEMKDINLIN